MEVQNPENLPPSSEDGAAVPAADKLPEEQVTQQAAPTGQQPQAQDQSQGQTQDQPQDQKEGLFKKLAKTLFGTEDVDEKTLAVAEEMKQKAALAQEAEMRLQQEQQEQTSTEPGLSAPRISRQCLPPSIRPEQ
jgi:hypothetical protein